MARCRRLVVPTLLAVTVIGGVTAQISACHGAGGSNGPDASDSQLDDAAPTIGDGDDPLGDIPRADGTSVDASVDARPADAAIDAMADAAIDAMADAAIDGLVDAAA